MMAGREGSGKMGERRLENIPNRFPPRSTKASVTFGLSNYQHGCDGKQKGRRDAELEWEVLRDSR
jgi:hypothetical protein